MNWKAKRVLVTGAGGFIGSHLTERLVRLGAQVACFVRYNSQGSWGRLEDLPGNITDSIRITAGDLKDPDAVLKAVRKTDIVFHLGALIAIPYSYIHPLDFVQTNVVGTVNVLNACLDAGVERMVHTSTSEVYGTARYVPIDEDHPLQGQSPYSASKIAADKMAESYHRAFGLPVVTVRPFNTYGPRQSARAIIPTIITQALTLDRIRVGSLHPRRDFMFVTDTVEGFIKAAESKAAVGEVVNLGTGRETSIGEICKTIVRLTSTGAKVVKDASRVRPKASEVGRLLADNRKARRLIGWKPAVNLEDGLYETVAWIADNIDLYKCGIYNV